MAFDQNVTYRVNVDDTNFQSKLTQMRASMDASLGGGGSGGFSQPMMYGMMNTMSGSGGGMGSGMADFGSQIRPVSYTPPAISFQPHFGMFQVQQSLAQAGLGAMGPMGAAAGGMITNFRNGGFGGLINGPNAIPNNMTTADYMAMSARGFGDRMGDAASIAVTTALSTTAGLITGGIGAAVGGGMFTGAIMKTVGGLVGGMAGATAVSAFTGEVTDMMADNRQMQSALAAGSFRFFTGGGDGDVDKLTGRGMGRRARAGVATAIQGMEQQDLRYGMDEYKSILEGGMQFDLFSGTHDTEDFKTKFKGLVETLKTVTATMHTSLKEGLEVIRGFRDMGVTDPSEVSRLTLGSEVRGRASGRTGMEMMAIGQAGAEMFRGTGINMERGFELNQMNTVGIRSMLNEGLLSRETIGQAGGENSLAQQMTASALSSFQTAQGRAAMMANYNQSTNSMSPNLMSNLARGDLMGQVAGAAGKGPGALLSFQANQEDLISKMSPEQMQLFGLSLDVGVAKTLRQAIPGLNMEDAIKVAGQQAGKSKQVIDTQLAMLHQDPEKMKANQEAAVEQVKMQAGLEDVRNRYNVGKYVSNTLRSTFVAPFSRAGTAISTGVGEAVENIALDLSGIARVDTNYVNKKSIAAAGTGDSTSGVVIDVTGGSFAQRHWGQTGQAGIDRASEEGFGHRFKDMNEATEYAKTHGNMQIGKDSKGNVIGVTADENKAQIDKARSWQSTQDDKDKASKADLSEEIGAKILGHDYTAKEFLRMTGGVSMKDMERADDKNFNFEKKYKHSRGYFTALAGRYADTVGTTDTTKKNLNRLSNASDFTDMDAAQAAAASKNIEGDTAALAKSMGVGGSRYLLSHPEALMTLADPSISDDVKRLRLNKSSGQEMGGLIEVASKHRGKDLDDKLEIVKNDIRLTAQAQAASGTGGTGSAIIGDLSKETVKLLETQSTQLLANYKALIALQEQLSKAMATGGKR
jgi:hypothetical protein